MAVDTTNPELSQRLVCKALLQRLVTLLTLLFVQMCVPSLQVPTDSTFTLVTTRIVTVIYRACLIVADALLLLATWTAVSRTIRAGVVTKEDASTFADVLLRDGESESRRLVADIHAFYSITHGTRSA